MDTTTILAIVVAVETLLLGAIGVLRVVAPRTGTTVDDSVLARLEQIESFLERIVPNSKPAADVK